MIAGMNRVAPIPSSFASLWEMVAVVDSRGGGWKKRVKKPIVTPPIGKAILNDGQ
jgi:hypothetical protein